MCHAINVGDGSGSSNELYLAVVHDFAHPPALALKLGNKKYFIIF